MANANFAKYANAAGDTFKGISQATGAATGTKLDYNVGTVGKGNLSNSENKSAEKKEQNISVEDIKQLKDSFASDVELKDFSDMKKSVSKLVQDVDLFLFKYKADAQKKYGLDNKKHVGVMAQQLASNPVTAPSVVEAPDGHLEVNTKELSMESIGLIADLARRIERIEKILGER